ncbi:MAG: ATP-binding protein [Bacilli bacterium]|nr:ATP-binding protein [Bacilli bacterium]
MEIKREKYLLDLISRKNNGLVKIITGLRRSGKSYLLFNIFYRYLLSDGVMENNIIRFAFDVDEDIEKLDKYFPEEETKIYEKGKSSYKVNSKKFRAYLKDLTNENERFYILLDEIQNLENFVGTLNGLLRKNNFDVYVTGSNSKFLSSDIVTEFRGRGDQVHVYPLSFNEFYQYKGGDFSSVYEEYSRFGGMPLVNAYSTNEQKSSYLKTLFEETYLKDILERNKIEDKTSLGLLLDVVSSSVGSYTNSTKLEKTFKSELGITYSHQTIDNHLNCFIDAFLINKATRYDVKGKKYLSAGYKYYFSDMGLRNARLNFRQQEATHIMENIIYNELLYRGYNVDVGVVETYDKNKNGNNVRKQIEIDFVVNQGDKRVYIQSAYSMPDKEKYNQEKQSLIKTNDAFKKIIIVNDPIMSYSSEDGIEIVSLKDFLIGKYQF